MYYAIDSSEGKCVTYVMLCIEPNGWKYDGSWMNQCLMCILIVMLGSGDWTWPTSIDYVTLRENFMPFSSAIFLQLVITASSSFHSLAEWAFNLKITP